MIRLNWIKKIREEEILRRNVGAFSDGVPPLPIPNRVVKPISADGTEVDASGE